MSRLLIAAFIAVLLFGSVPVARWQIRRARREESAQDRFIREACTPGLEVWDDRLTRWVTLPPGVQPGPHQYTDREVVALDQLELAWEGPAFGEAAASVDEGLARLFEQLGPPPAADPSWDAGLERLWDAARDNQKGDQT